MTTATEEISVFIVDDHGLLRGVMAIALESMDGVRVAGQAANGRQAVEAVVEIRPSTARAISPFVPTSIINTLPPRLSSRAAIIPATMSAPT